MKIKKLIAAPLVALSFALALTACSTGTPGGNSTPSGTSGGTFNSGNSAYDAIINSGAVADQATVDANQWAKSIKAAGVLRVGGSQTSTLFSLLNPTTNVVVGFDAGLSQLLARYIIGDAKTNLTLVTSSTREQVLTSNTVDAVFATYSITAARMQQIDFAGPYYSSQAGILVQSTNTAINGVADLAGKKVATQQGSTGVALLAQEAPQATVVQLPDNASCLAALQQGQVDAYVIDESILLNSLVTNNDVKLAGDPFGPNDNYGIGLPKGSDAEAFVNAWLQQIVSDGTWLKLWQATIQTMTNTTQVPTPPAIGSAGN